MLQPLCLRCLIVDDNVDFLDAAREPSPRVRVLDVVGTATNSVEALRAAQNLQPELILVDVYLGEERGIDLAYRLSSMGPGAPTVILISTYSEQDLGGSLWRVPPLDS